MRVILAKNDAQMLFESVAVFVTQEDLQKYKVSSRTIRSWMSGDTSIPESVFQDCVSIVR